MNPTISAYMRALQRKSTAAKWSGLSASERKRKMSELAHARWAKKKKSD